MNSMKDFANFIENYRENRRASFWRQVEGFGMGMATASLMAGALVSLIYLWAFV